MKEIYRKGLSILLMLCMVLALMPVITPSANATSSVMRGTTLDLTANEVYYRNTVGGTNAIKPAIQNITDCAEGWSWYPNGDITAGYPENTLVLDGMHLETGNKRGIYLPLNSTIVLADGSTNSVSVVNGTSGSLGYGVEVFDDPMFPSRGDLTVKGSGALSITVNAGTAVAIKVLNGQFNLESGTVHAKVDGTTNDYTLFADPLGPNVVAYQKSAADTYDLATTWNSSYLTFCYNGNNKTTDIKMVNGTVSTSSATVSNQTVSGKVGTELTGTNTATVTLTDCTFEELAVGDNVSDWFSDLPDGVLVSVSAVDETTATLTFSGTPTAPFVADMVITIPGEYLSTEDDMIVTANGSARFEIVQLVARLTQLYFDASNVIQYATSGGGTASANPTATNITNTGEGWAWYLTETGAYAAKTLVLDGINLATINDVAIRLPSGSTIVLADGSSNVVTSNNLMSNSYGIFVMGGLTVKGRGTLAATSGNTSSVNSVGVSAFDMLILDGTIVATGRGAGTTSCGIRAYGNLTIQNATVTATGGDANKNSYGIMSETGSVTFSGGTIYAKAGSGDEYSMAVYGKSGVVSHASLEILQKDEFNHYTVVTQLEEDGRYYVGFDNPDVFATDLLIAPAPTAVVSDLTVSGRVGAALSGTSAAAVTLTGCTFEELTVGDNVSDWFSGLPGGVSVSVSSFTETTATLSFFGTPETESSGGMSITIPGVKLSTGKSITVSANSGAKFEIIELVARTTPLNFTYNTPITYRTIGGTSSTNPQSQNITNTLEGWAWYRYANEGLGYNAYTLVLDGINLATDGDIPIELPSNSTVVLADGSSNTVTNTGNAANGHGFYGWGALTVKGSGTLNVVGGDKSNFSCGLYAEGDLMISQSTIVLAGKGTGMNSVGMYAYGNLRIENATVTATGGDNAENSYGIYMISGTLSASEVNATGGDNAKYSIGVYAHGDIVISASEVNATGGIATGESYGILSLTSSVAFSGGTTYVKAGTSPISYAVYAKAGISDVLMEVLQKDEALNYTVPARAENLEDYYSYLDSDNAVATDLRIALAPLGFPGSGTEAEPYQISTAAQLKEMSERVNEQNDLFGDKHYELTTDIVLNENIEDDPEQWDPIGARRSASFAGVFNGNTHTVSGLYINADLDRAGLFGFVENGTIKNLGLVDGYVASTSASGGIVGYMEDGSVENCYNTGTVKGIYVGGIVGKNYGGHIQDCYNTGDIFGRSFAGGIAGINADAARTIVNCYNTGSVTITVSELGNVGYGGGIAGTNSNASIKNCYSTGVLEGNATDGATAYMGGIAGSNDLEYEGIIENAYWLESVADNGIGWGPSGASCRTTTADPDTNGCTSMTQVQMKAATFVDTLNENVLTLEDTYTTISPWRAASIDENGGYPVLGTAISTYTLTISGGGIGATESGSYAAKASVPISAGTRSGYTFNGWTTENGGSFANAAAANTNFTMPGANVTITAGWVRSNDGGSSNPSSGSPTSTQVIVNGQSVSAGTSHTATDGDGKKVTNVTIDSGRLETILAAQSTGATVTIPIKDSVDRAVGTLTGQMVKSMENKAATLIVQTPSSSYTLPASEINIEAVSKQLGANVDLTDINVSVSVSSPSNEMSRIVENAGKDGGFSIVAPAVDFTITCTYGGRTVQVSLFNSYVQRTIAIPQGVDPSKITTGVVVGPEGNVHHVPTRVTVIGGQYYAVINSLTNSTYSVVWNPVEFSDVTNNWAKEAINNMGSRMVITGVGSRSFDPHRAITRAEFAAVIVRALGLKSGSGTGGFTDITSADWYAGYIQTAAWYGIIKGYPDKTFRPHDTITREQAMTMVARAMEITGLDANLINGDAASLIGAYADAGTVSKYAAVGVAACLKTEVVAGRGGKILAPLDKVTRAETAVMIERLLKRSGLI